MASDPTLTPADELVFGETVEALIKRVLTGHLHADFKARLRAAGLDVDTPLANTYPRLVWAEVLRLTARELYPSDSDDEAYFKVGAGVFNGFAETLMGRMLGGALRLMGPRRTIIQIDKNFRTANNYSHTKLIELDDHTFDLWLNECSGNPNFARAIITGGMKVAGAKDLEIEPTEFDGHACTFRCTWTP